MSTIRIAVAQTGFLVGAIEDNAKHIIALAEQAKTKGAHVVVFPELALIGYPPEDLLTRGNLSSRIQKAMNEISKVEGVAVVLGYPHLDNYGCFNSAAIIHDGRQRGFYHKQVLPTYGVFDEARYFGEGRNSVCFDYQGVKIGLLICEDLWKKAPAERLKEAGVDLIIGLNASPFEQGKHQRRKDVLTRRVKETGVPILYANASGSQDDLVFDGGSLAINADAQIVHECSRFEDALEVFEFSNNRFTENTVAGELSALGETYYALVVGLREFVQQNGFSKVVLGLSGGIDSALTATLAVDALGADNVTCVMMPFDFTSEASLEDAQSLATTLGCKYHVLPIGSGFHGTLEALSGPFEGTQSGVAEENLQARLRGTMLMALSNKFGHLVLATGNKSELAVGYCTLYGDMCGGFAPIKDLYKTQVYALAKYRNTLGETPIIPERIITRAPTAELRAEQTDQDSLPEYEVLDGILECYIEKRMGLDAIISKGFSKEDVAKVVKLVDSAEYKRRQGPIGPKVTRMAFGRERRYPIMNHWLKGL